MPFPLAHDDPPGLGSYRLLARLGSGGMGTVYLARSPGGRTLALKTMHARIATTTEFRTRFRLEADAARVLGGRYGAQVVEADPLAETPWMATEYVLGPPLEEAVALAGPLPEVTARALGAALCGALGQLHRSDVVHRDLKPSNIMVTADGPKVIDFGIARALGDDRLTRTGAAVGTPAFMSPEQATGQEHTPAGDVFALAGVLVFAATGRGPFGDGQPADLLYRVRYREPDLTGVPAALVPVLARALAKDPAERPSTAELAAQLHNGDGEFADHLPDAVLAEIGRRASEVWQLVPQRLPAPPNQPATVPSADVPAARGLSRRGLLLAGAGSVLGVAGAGAGVWAWLGRGEAAPGPATGPGYTKPKPGPSVSALKKKKLDSVWQKQISGPDDDQNPEVPLVAGDQVVMVSDAEARGVDPKSGETRWTFSLSFDESWEVASDGTHVYRIARAEERVAGSAFPKSVSWFLTRVDLATGKEGRHLAPVSDDQDNGLISRLLAVADDTAYLAVSRGKVKKYERELPWFVTALDLTKGSRKWMDPLPFRSAKSDEHHVLSAKVVGNLLVTLQQMNDAKVRIVARDLRTGKVAWDKPWKGADRRLVRDPLTADGKHLYLGYGPLRALRLSDGGQVWDTSGSRPGKTYGPPALKDGVLYAVEEDLGLVAFDAGSGKPRWTEKSWEGKSADHLVRPVIGSEYAYSYSFTGKFLRAVGLTSHTTEQLYKTSGTKFTAHEKSRMVIASGPDFLAGYPLR
ncbi:PQQ-binding-like beta-propeller repeat protein [Streptomyces sp. NPDC048197]|uniref:protein kinase domain-containing protein n=1 Tax=Streptomyces sp. NPDC048197 TaxID=3365511 RepID=UPI00371A06FE